MATVNKKTSRSHVYTEERLAGGYGPHAAKQSEEQELRRLVLACLLWEDIAYTSGANVVSRIQELCQRLPSQTVANLAVEARLQQKLRHVPLLLCRELARHPGNRAVLAPTLEQVIRRPDEMCEFLALYWKDNKDHEGNPKKTLSAQVKKGLRSVLAKFDQYQLSKWDKSGKEIRLRDAMFLVHGKTKDVVHSLNADIPAHLVDAICKESYKRGPVLRHKNSLAQMLTDKTLPPADTWEVGLSAAKSKEEKQVVWERLIQEKRLGSFAFLKNLRNMEEVNVDRNLIAAGLSNLKPEMLLPLDFLKAAAHAPQWRRELEGAMLKCAAEFPKLPGWTVFVVDVSGSMSCQLSSKSQFNRMDAGAAMAILAAEMCSHISVYATAGNDGTRIHATEWIKPLRGFALSDAILEARHRLGGGGIFTRQCLEYIEKNEKTPPDRIVVFSDSQDCDLDTSKKPKPFGKYNYIVDVSSHTKGINYEGVWTSEIAGWSENFLRYIAACESSLN